MKKYTIHFRGQKLRSKRSEPDSDPKLVDEWKDTVQSDKRPAVWQLTDFVYSRHGIAGVHFSHVPSQPGLFLASQPEDARGGYNPRGAYQACVVVRIACARNEPTVPVGSLGLPAFKPTNT